MGKLAAAVAVGLAGFGAAQQADASLIVDVRATAVNGQPLTAGSTAKDVSVAPGDVVTLQLFAQITGTNGLNDETVQAAHGQIVSGAGAGLRLLGNLSGGVVSPFNGSGYQNGSNVDLDADTDLDIGAPLGSAAATALGYFLARANTPTLGTTDLSPQSEEIQIGQVSFTVGSAADPAETLVNFIKRSTATGGNQTTAATWAEDGVTKNGGTGVFGSGTPVRIAVAVIPEPTGLALAGLATLGLLGRRRKNA